MCPATIGDKIRRKKTFRNLFATQKVGLGGAYIYIILLLLLYLIIIIYVHKYR